MTKTVNVSFTGFGLVLLTIAFFVAKVTGYINWSWWLVFAPLWAPLAIAAVVIFCIFIVALAVA